jgi:hypothetical protein
MQLTTPEKTRTYFYQDGTKVDFKNVTFVAVTKSGFHKLEADGGKYIVAPGWRYIALDVEAWTF